MKLISIIFCFLIGILSMSFSLSAATQTINGKFEFHNHKKVQEKFPSPTNSQEAELFERVEDDDSVSERLEINFSKTCTLLYSISTFFFVKSCACTPPILFSVPLFIKERKLRV